MIDDAALRPLAVSAQTGLLDASRVEAVLHPRPRQRHRRVVRHLRRRAAPGGFVLASPGQDELVAITTRDATGLLRGAVRAVAGPPLVIGTADAASTLAAVHARLNDARYAAEVAAHVPAFGGTADWGELGSYAVFQYLPPDKAAPGRT